MSQSLDREDTAFHRVFNFLCETLCLLCLNSVTASSNLLLLNLPISYFTSILKFSHRTRLFNPKFSKRLL